MPVVDDNPFYECYLCFGDNQRERRSVGSPICKFDGCIKEHRRRRNGELPDDESEAALPAKVEPTACYKIRDVLGIDMCVKSDSRGKRAGCKLVDDNISYKIRGGFGEDKDDELIPDTRWVKLPELLANMDAASLKALDKWAGKLQKTAEEARKRLKQRRNEEDA